MGIVNCKKLLDGGMKIEWLVDYKDEYSRVRDMIVASGLDYIKQQLEDRLEGEFNNGKKMEGTIIIPIPVNIVIGDSDNNN